MSRRAESSLRPGMVVHEPVAAEIAPQDERVFDYKEILAHPLFKPTAFLVIALCAAYWTLWKVSFEDWVAPDSLYSHGPLIPFLAGYIVWVRWPKMKDTPVKPSAWAGIALLPILYLSWIAARTEMKMTEAALFLLSAGVSIWFVAGFRWFLQLAPVVAFLAFCLPLWTSLVDHYTLTMQHLSADMAVTLLQLCQLHPIRGADPTTVYLDHFTLNVAAACSGAKLTLALVAFTAFFMLTRTAKVWANIFLALIVIPFCLFVNGIRIAMVGIVGDSFGEQVGRQFHDYGGYIALVLCFLMLNWITKSLGFK